MHAIYRRLQRLETHPRRPSTVATETITPTFAGQVLDILTAIGALDPAAPRTLTIVQDGRAYQVAAA
jgi:hypothetical protein